MQSSSSAWRSAQSCWANDNGCIYFRHDNKCQDLLQHFATARQHSRPSQKCGQHIQLVVIYSTEIAHCIGPRDLSEYRYILLLIRSMGNDAATKLTLPPPRASRGASLRNCTCSCRDQSRSEVNAVVATSSKVRVKLSLWQYKGNPSFSLCRHQTWNVPFQNILKHPTVKHCQRKFRSSNFRLYWKLPVALAASMFSQQRCFGG